MLCLQEEAQTIPDAQVQVVEKGTGDWPGSIGIAEAPAALPTDFEAPPVEGFQHEEHPVRTVSVVLFVLSY